MHHSFQFICHFICYLYWLYVRLQWSFLHCLFFFQSNFLFIFLCVFLIPHISPSLPPSLSLSLSLLPLCECALKTSEHYNYLTYECPNIPKLFFNCCKTCAFSDHVSQLTPSDCLLCRSPFFFFRSALDLAGLFDLFLDRVVSIATSRKMMYFFSLHNLALNRPLLCPS